MHHIKPTSKGDPLCPLGFHPQVRWPTRCKRCFRDYKEHGNRNKEQDAQLRREELTASTPALSYSSSRNRDESVIPGNTLGSRTWTSSSNLSSASNIIRKPVEDSISKGSSWTSFPNLSEQKDEAITVSFTLPKKKQQLSEEKTPSTNDGEEYKRTQYTVRRRTSPLNVPVENKKNTNILPPSSKSNNTKESLKHHQSSADVDFIFTVKSVPKNQLLDVAYTKEKKKGSNESLSSDDGSIANTETTETTIVNPHEQQLQEEIDSLKKELDTMKARCEKAEREKSDIMLRRLATLEATSSKTSASEVLKLQQKCNEMKSNVEDLKDEKKVLSIRVRELEADLELTKAKSTQKEAEQLRGKLQAAETLCEELMEENEDMKRELKDMEEEMVEMQDNFREDQADEYSSMKKELEQTTKNCRILTFKLRKAERRSEQLDTEKLEAERKLREIAGGQAGLDKAERIRQLEHDLAVANEAASRLQKDLEDAKSQVKSSEKNTKLVVKKKAPMLGSMPKTSSGEKVSRESLTRGGSQEDPVQLLRDLQDSLEREADLREQLRQAEEEAQSLRKKASRVEDDNESLVLQLKKMATKARTRRHSPSPQRLTPEPIEKDEGISDEDDPAELKILLELNEQEAGVLRRKVEDLESEGDLLRKKVEDLQDKLATKTNLAKKTKIIEATKPLKSSDALYEQKMKVLEDEMGDLRKKLIEKERECERLHAEISFGVKKPKVLQKSKSLDGDQQTLDLKRQLQVIDSEASVLRTRIQDIEAENEKLQAENKKLSLLKATKVRSSSVERVEDEKNKISLLEKQLEESKNKIKEFEKITNTSIKKDSTVAVGEIEKLKAQLKKADSEKKKYEESLKRLKEDAVSDILNFYQKRSPKVPTDLTTKLQMKKMVEEGEKEIGELLVILKKVEDEKKNCNQNNNKEDNDKKGEFQNIKIELEKKLEESQEEYKIKVKDLENLRSSIKELEEEKNKLKKETEKYKNQFDKEKQKSLDSKAEFEKQKREFAKKIEELQEQLKEAKSFEDEVPLLKDRIDRLCEDLAEEKKKTECLQKELEIEKNSNKNNVLKEVEEKQQAILDLQKKMKEVEEKMKKSEKLLGLKKEKISKIEKEKEELASQILSFKKQQTSIIDERKEFSDKIEKVEQKAQKLEKDLNNKILTIEQLESSLKREKEARNPDSEAQNTAMNEINKLQEEVNSLRSKVQESLENLEKAEKEKKAIEDSANAKEKQMCKEIEQWENKASELEMDLQEATEECAAERKMTERLKSTQEKDMKAKDLEIAQLRAKSHTAGAKKLNDLKQEMQSKIDGLEIALASEKQEYDELTGKYELLEEEHVITKAQLTKDKEKLHGQLLDCQRELVESEAELKALRETFNNKQDAWIKEKLDIQDKLKENDNWLLEKVRLQAIVDEKQSDLDRLKNETQMLNDQQEFMRKENEELRKELEDYERVSKVERNLAADNSALEKQLRDCKTKFIMEEKARKADLSSLKARYENRVSVISAELLSTQGQMARFKKERDSYKHMMEAAQKTISERKSGSGTHQPSKYSYEGEDMKDNVLALEQQISCLEDELSEARVDASRLRTELVSERSAWEVRVSELSSRLNELEEEKILNSGRTKISGLKTKMELAWHKEREEQHRLLQETSTLARDLRQTLFEVERERDKERLEAKRRLDQQKKTAEEEQEELRKKLNDMHCDLLELRDAHAKLRTTNEKLRREKEKWEKDKEIMRQSHAVRKKAEQDEERRIITVAQLVEELTVLAPGLFPSKPKPQVGLPTPPIRRKGPKSREASPQLERRDLSRESSIGKEDAKTQEVHEILARLTEAASTLKRYQRASEERDVSRKGFASRRAASTESDGGTDTPTKREGLRRKGSMLRKSLSLEQTAAQEQQAIWKLDDDQGSIPSIQSLDDMEQFHHLQRRDPSMDSRLSGGSTRSEILPSTEKKKKGGLFGKLKKLAKSSKSLEQNLDSSDLDSMGQLDRGSDSSLSTVDEKSGRFKDKLSGMFRKSGSTSRGNSVERNTKPPTGLTFDSTQRPLINSSALSSNETSSKKQTEEYKKPSSSSSTQRKVKK